MWADSRAVSQPTPSACLWANAVLKWAHYHQREHKHSSRKQDSLCQEREPLPQAQCRPEEITRLKIRQGSYHYCRHAPPAAPAAEEDNPHSCSNIPFHLSLWLQLLSSSIMCLLQAAGGLMCICVKADPQSPSFFPDDTIMASLSNFLGLCPAVTVMIIEIPAIAKCQFIIHDTLWVRIWFVHTVCHAFIKHLAAVPLIRLRLTYFSISSSPQNFFQIISNLLEEENKEKWEDAHKVSTALYAE